MNLTSIQIGLDIATSISIVGAAIAFIINRISDRKKRQLFAIQEMRIKYLQEAASELAALVRSVLVLQDRIKWAAVLNEDIPSKDIVQIAFDVKNNIACLRQGSLSVWASKEDIESVVRLESFADEWAKRFAGALKKECDALPVDSLIDKILETQKSLSESIKNQLRYKTAM